MIANDDKLVEVLLQRSMIDPQDMIVIQQSASKANLGLVDYMLLYRLTTEENVYNVLTSFFNMEFVSLKSFRPKKGMLSLIPEAVARKYSIFPLFRVEDKLTVAMADPFNKETILKDVKDILKIDLEFTLATASDMAEALNRYYPDTGVCEEIDDIAQEIVDNSEKDNI